MKNIIVTGAGKGLGRAIAENLITAGLRVFAVDIDKDLLRRLKTDLGDSVEPAIVDVADEPAVEMYFRNLPISGAYGLVNNAGIYYGKSILEYTSAEMMKVIGVNLLGAINFSKHFARLNLSQNREGSIVNISSSSVYGGGDAVYSSSKAGLIGLTKSCAIKFSPLIRVNAVTPGIVDTDILQQIPDEIIAWYRKTELIKKPLQPLDVAHTVRFLLGDESRNYTGAVFDLNNGFHL